MLILISYIMYSLLATCIPYFQTGGLQDSIHLVKRKLGQNGKLTVPMTSSEASRSGHTPFPKDISRFSSRKMVKFMIIHFYKIGIKFKNEIFYQTTSYILN